MIALDDEPTHTRHLADKFARMIALREEKVAFLEAYPGEEFRAPADRMRRLAADFPGALRELDRMPLESLRVRWRAVDDLASGHRVDATLRQFVRAQCGYHLFLRSALCVRRATHRVCDVAELRSLRSMDGGDQMAMSLLTRIGATYSAEAREMLLPTWTQLDVTHLRLAMNPPGGRLHVAALFAVADWLGDSPEQIEAKIFPYADAHRRTES